MSISIDQIKELREATGVSMMACKKSLEEAGGDFDEAVNLLRKKGAVKAADRSVRATAQGIVVTKTEGGKTAMIQLLCETDFVSRGDDFLKLAESVVEKLLKGEVSSDDTDLPEIKEAVLRLGENIKVGAMEVFEGENVGNYVHSNGLIGVLVSVIGGTPEVARDIAMHVAAADPAVLSPDEVSSDLVAKEKDIWVEQLKNEGKPSEIIEKILIGKENKFRGQNALLKQPFVKSPDKSIEELLKESGAEVEKFVRFSI